MTNNALAARLLLTAVFAQVSVQGHQGFKAGTEWNHNYTLKHTPPQRRTYIYRAYRDAPEDKLVLFAEVLEDVAGQITHCFVQPFQQANFSVPAIVSRLPAGLWGWRTLEKRRYALEEFVPVRVECSLRKSASFQFAAASLMAGDEALHGIAEVVDVPTKRVGQVAACVGPLVTGKLPQEWLDHHQALGVEQFYSFVPFGKEYSDGKYNLGGDVPQNILDYLQWSGVFPPEAITLTPHASLEYLLYMPPATTYYFGQFAMMHACWYMQRYAYDFVLYLDTDEFLWLRSDFMEKRRPLQAWLGKVPETTVSILVKRYNYPTKCQRSKDSNLPLAWRANTRQEQPHEMPKLILRPKDITIASNHFPKEAARNMELLWADDEIRIKHIRDGGPRYASYFGCNGLVKDPPEWRPSRQPASWRRYLECCKAF